MSLLNRQAWIKLWAITAPFFRSEERTRAISALLLLILLLLTVSGLNVVNSYVGRDFMTALADRQAREFAHLVVLYVLVFAASTLIAVFYRFTEERLGLFWRRWLTANLMERYLTGNNYFRLQNQPEIDNPDQRMTDDVRTFTTTSLSLLLIFLNATITMLAFAGVLWSITPWLLIAAVVYATFGTLMTLLLGRKLISLNFMQLKREADLRYELIRVRENAESIALYRGGPRENMRLNNRLRILVDNFRNIIGVNRNLGFFTTGYNYLTQIIPAFVVAPLYFSGQVEFGVVTQAAMAFAHVLGAFSLIVTEFQRLSSFAAVISRVSAVHEGLEEPTTPIQGVDVVEDGPRVAFEHVTLWTPCEGKTLIKDLNMEIPPGSHLLISGPNGAGKSAIYRAVAELWQYGDGRIIRPQWKDVIFLPPKPYTVQGTLRDQFVYAMPQGAITDDGILKVLHKVKFDSVLARVGGLNAERDWQNTLSTGELQVLAFVRLLLAKPRFAFLDGATSALDMQRERALYKALEDTSITYISIGDHTNLKNYHNLRLEINDDGTWRMCPIREKLVSICGN